MPRSTLMVDAWAWIALYNPADQCHDIARLANEELLAARYSLLTTNFILDEAYTALRQWGSPARAISFGRKIQAIAASGALEIVTITPEIERLRGNSSNATTLSPVFLTPTVQHLP
jgi:predicted nucleic acid-binding protein